MDTQRLSPTPQPPTLLKSNQTKKTEKESKYLLYQGGRCFTDTYLYFSVSLLC